MNKHIQRFAVNKMKRDSASSRTEGNHAFEIKNMRLFSLEDSSTMALSNERGNKETEYKFEEGDIPIGQAEINNKWIIFTTSETVDKIWCVNLDKNRDGQKIDTIKVLAYGDFGFDKDFPIEAIGYYETETLKKVYWVDGKNQPRMINIEDDEYYKQVIHPSDGDKFNFTTSIRFIENYQEGGIEKKRKFGEVSIEKIDFGGLFPAGTIQYHLTYSYKNGQESSIFYSSPLYYTTLESRSGSATEDCYCSFKITIKNPDWNYQQVNVYSILSNNYGGITAVKKVASVDITGIGSYGETVEIITLTDNGTTGEDVESTTLLYKDGDVIYPNTLTIKQSKLFLGNYKLENNFIEKSVRDRIKDIFNSKFEFKTDIISEGQDSLPHKYLEGKEDEGELYSTYLYPLKRSSEDEKTFMFNETYRLGFQLQDKYGKWTTPLFIGDHKNESAPRTDYLHETTAGGKIISYTLPYGQLNYSTITGDDKTFVDELLDKYVRIRPVIVYPSLNDRKIVAQGVINPTLFNVEDRSNKKVWSFASWNFRPYAPFCMDYREKGIEDSWKGITGDRKGKYLNGDNTGLPVLESAAGAVNSEEQYPIIKESNFTYLNQYTSLPSLYSRRGGNGALSSERRVYKLRNKVDNTDVHSGYLSGMFEKLGNDYSLVNTSKWFDFSKHAGVLEFRHNFPITSSLFKNGEIKSLDYVHRNSVILGDAQNATVFSPYTTNDGYEFDNRTKEFIYTHYNVCDSDLVEEFEEGIFIDQNTQTFHSPEINFNEQIWNINFKNIKLNLIGFVPIEKTRTDYELVYDSSFDYTGSTDSDLKSNIGIKSSVSFFNPECLTKGIYGYRCATTFNNYIDYLNNVDIDDDDEITARTTRAFPIYLWDSGYLRDSLSNESKSKILYKQTSTVRFSDKTTYFKSIELADKDTSSIGLFKSNDFPLISILKDNEKINYYGNLDKLILPKDGEYDFYSTLIGANTKNLTFDTEEILSYIESRSYNPVDEDVSLDQMGIINIKNSSFNNSIYSLLKRGDLNRIVTQLDGIYKSHQPVQINYRCTPHLIISFNNGLIPPAFGDINKFYTDNISELTKYENFEQTYEGDKIVAGPVGIVNYFWGEYKLSQNSIDLTTFNDLNPFFNIKSNKFVDVSEYFDYNFYRADNTSPERGYLWLVELERTDIQNQYGGEENENNKWIPCGDAVTIDDFKENGLYFDEGDTFFQRYDCLKTYPFSEESINQNVDILSFMVQTRVNIEGRYDERGNERNDRWLYCSPENFNLINPVYNNINDYFSYNILTDEQLKNVNFITSYTWSTDKIAGEKIDSWTNVKLTANLDLDGSYGVLRKLINFNDRILAFQDKAISMIAYNERGMIQDAAGLPIELSKNTAVEGHTVLVSNIGCTNKWSVVKTLNGIYFIDNINKALYVFNDRDAQKTSDIQLFHSFFRNHFNEDKSWKSYDMQTFCSYYDNVNNEILFINKDYCLAFSLNVDGFTSFYSYENTPYFMYLNNRMYSLHKTNERYGAWIQNEGRYNSYFGEYQPYYIEFFSNPNNGLINELFTNIEFIADSWKINEGADELYHIPDDMMELIDPYAQNGDGYSSYPFDNVEAWNEYQHGWLPLHNTLNQPDFLKKKFRVWDIVLPRDGHQGKPDFTAIDRMSNPWLKIKLNKQIENYNRTIMYNFGVVYYDNINDKK